MSLLLWERGGGRYGTFLHDISLILRIMMCSFSNFLYSVTTANGLQMGTMISNSVQDAGFDARELSHRSYRSVSMPASFIKFNAPSNLWTLSSYVKHVHLATVIIQTLTPQPKANDR